MILTEAGSTNSGIICTCKIFYLPNVIYFMRNENGGSNIVSLGTNNILIHFLGGLIITYPLQNREMYNKIVYAYE